MDKKEFFTLVDKHEKGQCSKAEEQALLQFYDRLQSRKVMASWDLSEKEEAKIRLLKRILHTVRHQKREKVTPFHWKALAKIAAVFIGVLGIGYVVLQNTLFGPEEIPDNVITLELEDGSIEVIEDDGNATVEQSGQIIGKQQGGQMVYAQNANIEKLVYNTLKVPYGKKFNIQLSDGSVVQLNSGSSITYPVNFIAGEDRKIALQGEAFFEVQKDSIHPFLVNTGLLEIEVLGTRFNVIAYTEDEETNVVLTEGSVSLRADNAKSEDNDMVLEPGFMGSLNKTDGSISAKKVNTAIYTSWLTGSLIFRDAPFKNILLKLERRYNVAIENRNQELDRLTFNTHIDVNEESIEQALKLFRDIHPFDYEIIDRKIIIKP